MESFGEPTLLMSTPLESKDTAMMEMDDSFVPTSLLLSTTKDVDEQEDMGFGFAGARVPMLCQLSKPNSKHTQTPPFLATRPQFQVSNSFA